VAVLSNKTIITLTLVLHALFMSEAATGAPLLAAVKAIVGRVALTLAGPGIALARQKALWPWAGNKIRPADRRLQPYTYPTIYNRMFIVFSEPV
jgi:hypothetical protein